MTIISLLSTFLNKNKCIPILISSNIIFQCIWIDFLWHQASRWFRQFWSSASLKRRYGLHEEGFPTIPEFSTGLTLICGNIFYKLIVMVSSFALKTSGPVRNRLKPWLLSLLLSNKESEKGSSMWNNFIHPASFCGLISHVNVLLLRGMV